MNLLQFLAILYLILSKINCTILQQTNHTKLKLAKSSNSENNEREEIHFNNISHENSDELERYLLNYCKDEEYLHKFISHDNKTQMIWVTWNRTKAGERAVLPNICSVKNGLPLRRRCYPDLVGPKWQNYDNKTVLIDCRISMFCQAESFQHYIIENNGELTLHQNSWKRAKIGEYSTLRDLCLQPNGLHLTRKCIYDYKLQRAKWTSIEHLNDFKCLQHTRQELITEELNSLHGNMTTSNFLVRDMNTRRHTATILLNLLEKPKVKLLPADVQLTSEILKNIVTDNQDLEISRDILKITHNLMATDPVVLRMSAEVNATNCLLETFENYMDALTERLVSDSQCQITLPADSLPITNNNDTSVEILNLSNMGVYGHITRNISVFFVNPNCAHISGIAIYDSYQLNNQFEQPQLQNQIYYDSLNDFHYRFIFMNESINDLLQETNLELASFIPMDMWYTLQQKFYSSLSNTRVVVFKIYAHDGLFVEQNLLRSRKPFSKILSISIPGFTDELPGPLPFILRHKSLTNNMKSSLNTGCGYWNYSTWTSNGVYTNSSQYTTASSNLILCSTNHLTQFSYLLGGGFRQNDLTDEILVTAVHQEALDIISIIGCTLSLLGLVGIWITALLFKSWRSQASNKVLLNMCVALTLQMVLFLFVNTDDVAEALVEKHSYTKCIVLGALLQYSILVLFTWMLIVAFLQFQRYVTVIGIQRPKHYIIKSAIIAWGLPLVPTLLVALLDSKSYIPSNYQLATDTGICYPSGNGLHFGVILPVSLIVLANLAIFLYVFYSISHTLSMSMQRNEKQMVIKQIRLSILLFFLLGLSWIFGIFAFMKAGIVFSYLFCLTATMQGFVLFIYFVIIDENARTSWQKLLCPTCVKKSREKKTAELQSMTTATTSLTHDMSSSRDH
ncbi:uncharacterized protein LOC119599827 [Lucilia sericata]|uniref:uncharacterized protein LOC119599827 n=1 Tax=Lucilia sericata TaxID=13632 RepID=UPI0018A7F963|nr:uncharacterized protein LOC119599827 [Lucilia sericata]